MNVFEKVLAGLTLGVTAGLIWETQRNPPKVYLGNRRVHHYEAGGILLLLALLTESPTAAGIGVGLFLHDINDVPM